MTLQPSPPAAAATTVCRPSIAAPRATDHDAPSRARPPYFLLAALYRPAFLLLCRLAVGARPTAHDDAR